MKEFVKILKSGPQPEHGLLGCMVMTPRVNVDNSLYDLARAWLNEHDTVKLHRTCVPNMLLRSKGLYRLSGMF